VAASASASFTMARVRTLVSSAIMRRLVAAPIAPHPPHPVSPSWPPQYPDERLGQTGPRPICRPPCRQARSGWRCRPPPDGHRPGHRDRGRAVWHRSAGSTTCRFAESVMVAMALSPKSVKTVGA
jgi:hypothetical protein